MPPPSSRLAGGRTGRRLTSRTSEEARHPTKGLYMRKLSCAGVIGIIVAITACSKTSPYSQVQGRVLIDGKPLEGVVVSFLLAPKDAPADAPVSHGGMG